MDKFQAAFEILYLLAASDGKVSTVELDVIRDFLESHYGKIDFDPNIVIKSVNTMTSDGRAEEFSTAVMDFKNTSNAQDRNILLDFCLKLIAADGVITDFEESLFYILGNTWNIDMKSYLAEKLS